MFKLFKLASISLLIIASFSQVSFAREFADIYTECGLGAMIAPKNEAVAAVTNVTWDLGTTAISSNISSPDSCAGGKEKMAAFINDSQDLLINELASGNGDYLDALTILAGVDQNQKDAFIAALRVDVSKALENSNFSTLSSFDKAQMLYNLVDSNLTSNS
jgi:hypothetical protein